MQGDAWITGEQLGRHVMQDEKWSSNEAGDGAYNLKLKVTRLCG